MKNIFSVLILCSLLITPVASATTYPPLTQPASIRVMGYGSAGDDVVLLQQTLQRLGYFPTRTRITGYYGVTTYRAVQQFQRAHNIVMTGRVGPRTQAALMKYVQPTNTSYVYCIPPGINLNESVANEAMHDGWNEYNITIREKLSALGATCNGGILHAANGKPIYFYRMKGYWGNAPYNYEELRLAESNEIIGLSNQYELVLISCTSGGHLIQ